ncbi:hypothetical protein [Actinomadura sp. 7K534]|uniref:hypothetical protein n=1 Tax=Actinomadura sp. 7K534 TaxID=2530366 RepID=UPI0010537D08|nr:hypothetical protein [Actinomadura sp. 7K534]TDB96074.1 hypothetical protein E1266_11180 [Actinomadura sp. 7K534]
MIAATATILGLTAVPASATPFTGTNTSDLLLVDVTLGTLVTCTSTSLVGDAPGPPGSALKITDASFSECTLDGSHPVTDGLDVHIEARFLPWNFTIISGYWGRLTYVELELWIPALGCRVLINAPVGVSGTYASGSPNVLQLEAFNLEASAVYPQCGSGLFRNFHPVGLLAQYEIS